MLKVFSKLLPFKKKHNPYHPFTKEDFDRGYVTLGEIVIGLGKTELPQGTLISVDMETILPNLKD